MSQNLKEKVLVRIGEINRILNSEFPTKSTLISPYIISFLFIGKGGIFGVGKFGVKRKNWKSRQEKSHKDIFQKKKKTVRITQKIHFSYIFFFSRSSWVAEELARFLEIPVCDFKLTRLVPIAARNKVIFPFFSIFASMCYS
ncbi:hypothetical protein AABB24_018199 [Solanum stoloniferum]|uniref:Uncharacterized protein n=1 Tax=Solanum stoloniferum TaxID=62892 RepID=A0ABD2TB51_9SOLN